MKLGVWCSNLEKRFPEGREDIKREMERLAKAGVNFYAPFIYGTGIPPLYSSSLIRNTKRDLLTPILEEASQYKIEVHPIILPFNWYECDVGEDKKEISKRFYQPAQKLPLNFQGRLCASWEENADIAMRIIEDIVKNYDLSGIHLDAIRYIDTGIKIDIEKPRICLCQACRNLYKNYIGKEVITGEDFKNPGIIYQWIKLRAKKIKDLVMRIRKFTNEKGLKLSMAARANYLQSAIVEGQEWVDWAKEGLIDSICTMNYCLDTNLHKERVKEHVQLIDKKVELLDGIGRRFSGGEMSSNEMLVQIKDAIESGADGVMIFHSTGLTDEDLKELAKRR